MNVFCGPLASATAFKTSLFASAIDAVGIASYVAKWSGQGPFGSGTDRQ